MTRLLQLLLLGAVLIVPSLCYLSAIKVLREENAALRHKLGQIEVSELLDEPHPPDVFDY